MKHELFTDYSRPLEGSSNAFRARFNSSFIDKSSLTRAYFLGSCRSKYKISLTTIRPCLLLATSEAFNV